MSRPFKGEEAVAEALKTLATARNVDQMRQAQAVVLPLRYGLSLGQTAEALGITRRWASQLRNRFLKGQRVTELPPRSGRHHAHFTPCARG